MVLAGISGMEDLGPYKQHPWIDSGVDTNNATNNHGKRQAHKKSIAACKVKEQELQTDKFRGWCECDKFRLLATDHLEDLIPQRESTPETRRIQEEITC